MAISPLAEKKIISPNSYRPRAYKITKITPHHMAGNLTIEQCGSVFSTSARQASSNYGIGTDGRIACYVDEANAAWTSSNYDNDNRAVTIEVANSSIGGNYPVSDKAWESLVNLCVDVCKRNDIKKLNYTGDASGNLTEHRMFAPTSCPGDYLHARMGKLAKEVNEKLMVKAGWQKDDKGWWYRNSDGSYPKNKWQKINNKWYHFDNKGYMQTGWIKDKGKSYYLDDNNGDMKTGWVKLENKDHIEKWYYLTDSGAMYSNGFLEVKGKWYAFDKNGEMAESTDEIRVAKNGSVSVI